MMRKRKAQLEMLPTLYMVIVLGILAIVYMQIRQFQSSSEYMEDALAASNLASAVIDMEEFGATHLVQIKSPEEAYVLYQEALKVNLNLDDQFIAVHQDIIAGRVQILRYIVYNVTDEDVEVFAFGEKGHYHESHPGMKGILKAPNGETIQHTSVYSEISFPVQGIWDVQTVAQKEKLVDVVMNVD
jgi:tetratricopeptide (TPR) repeat protein